MTPTTSIDTQTSQDTLLTSVELATLLNKPRSWVYNNAHQLPTLRVGNGLRWRRSDIEAWLDRSRVPSTGGIHGDPRHLAPTDGSRPYGNG